MSYTDGTPVVAQIARASFFEQLERHVGDTMGFWLDGAMEVRLTR